jgi:hypothetical protein
LIGGLQRFLLRLLPLAEIHPILGIKKGGPCKAPIFFGILPLVREHPILYTYKYNLI